MNSEVRQQISDLPLRTGSRTVEYMGETVNATEARANFYRLLASVNESEEPVTITSKNGNAILVSEDYWDSIQATMELYAVPGLVEDILAGMEEPLDTTPLEW